MPQPVKTEKEEPEVKVLPSETTQEKEKVTIDAGTGKPVEPPVSVPTSVSPDEFRKIQARMEFQARQNEQLQRKLDETLQRLQIYQPASQKAEKPQQDDEFDPALDAIAKENWQKGVAALADKRAEAIAEKKFKALMEQHEKDRQESFTRQQSINQLEREKAWVIERTPSLNDETSEEFKGYYATYNKMLSEDPSLLNNPRAPRLVWHEWKMSESETKPAANAEAERLKRIAAGSLPQGRPGSSKPKTYQLTQEEIDFCNSNKLSPARYAQMKEANFKEGVTA